MTITCIRWIGLIIIRTMSRALRLFWGMQRLSAPRSPSQQHCCCEQNHKKKNTSFNRYGTVQARCSVYETPFVVVPPKAPLHPLCAASPRPPPPHPPYDRCATYTAAARKRRTWPLNLGLCVHAALERRKSTPAATWGSATLDAQATPR